MSKLKIIIIAALLLRIFIAFLGEHGDTEQYYYWSKDIYKKGLTGFYDRNIDNAERPNYPPVTSYLFWTSAFLHEQTYHAAWVINTKVAIFPSNLILWLESPKSWYFFNKLPAITADLAIIWLLYKFSRKISPQNPYLASIYFAFLPPFWYNSSLWGQTESIFALPMLASFYLLNQNRPAASAALYGLSVLAKLTSLIILPVFIFWWLKKSNLNAVLSAVLVCLLEVFLLHLPFHPQNLIGWMVEFYQYNLPGKFPSLTANAFNFWSLIYGFKAMPETTLFFGIPANLIGYTIFLAIILFSLGFLFKLRKKSDIKTFLLPSAFVSFSAFIFLPKMHERYFYPVLILLLPLIGADKKIRYIFLSLAAIHLVNLYHGWWVPQINILRDLFSDSITERFLIINNLILFFMLGKRCFMKSSGR